MPTVRLNGGSPICHPGDVSDESLLPCWAEAADEPDAPDFPVYVMAIGDGSLLLALYPDEVDMIRAAPEPPR